ncbi:hypothetical protein [Yersinia enterocolitica]|uniref:hypothetical protein n=1 Tax=Yersinia enterocolitica TaxID=630 RepID=UPI0005DC8170|nr:hypothetical protein [Yersinia enterocolitica]CNL25461.1 Uncharacterised protein [Yersinia frederiksenii]
MLSKELINGAMLSSLEGFSFSVVDSLEFELNRKLTANEHQEVFAFVGSAVPDSASLREQLAELKAWATNRAITDDARENENYTTLKIDYRQRQLRELLKAAKPAEE